MSENSEQLIISMLTRLEASFEKKFDELRGAIQHNETTNTEQHGGIETRVRTAENKIDVHSWQLKLIGTLTVLALSAALSLLIDLIKKGGRL